MNREEAQHALANAKRTINNRRVYAQHSGVVYPLASLVWCANTGEWPKSTPRHWNNDPLDNSFANLRPPGRAKRVTVQAPTPDSLKQLAALNYDDAEQQKAHKALGLFA